MFESAQAHREALLKGIHPSKGVKGCHFGVSDKEGPLLDLTLSKNPQGRDDVSAVHGVVPGSPVRHDWHSHVLEDDFSLLELMLVAEGLEGSSKVPPFETLHLEPNSVRREASTIYLPSQRIR